MSCTCFECQKRLRHLRRERSLKQQLAVEYAITELLRMFGAGSRAVAVEKVWKCLEPEYRAHLRLRLLDKRIRQCYMDVSLRTRKKRFVYVLTY